MPDDTEPESKSPVAQWVSIIGLALGFALNRYEGTKHGHEIEQTQIHYVDTDMFNSNMIALQVRIGMLEKEVQGLKGGK